MHFAGMDNTYTPTLRLRAAVDCTVNCRDYKMGQYLQTIGGNDLVFRSVKAAIKAKFALNFANYDTIAIEQI